MAIITGTRKHDYTDTSDVNFASRARAQDREPNTTDVIADKLKPEPAPSVDPPNEAIVWNEIMLQAIAVRGFGPPPATRAMAIESLAVFNAVSAIEGTPGYLMSLTAPEDASAVAAVAQAAHDVLIHLFPAQSVMLDAKLALSLGAVEDGQSESDGIAVGAQAAAAMIALRADDGASASVAYAPGTDPGMWQPTPPGYSPLPALPQWADLDPFALVSPDQFLPDGPPALTSREYAKALKQVQSLGEADSTLRTDEQTEIAEYWHYGPRTPPGHWNDIATDIAEAEGLSLTETAQLLATLNVAEADAIIAAWDAKYFYDTWRPVTAINENEVFNRWVSEDPGWLPLIDTPNFPEYVSAHSTISAAAAEVLTAFFGKHYEFSFTAPGAPGAETPTTRVFDSFWDAAKEAGMSRIYGGIHFSFANEDGLELGEDVAEWVLQSFAQNSSADAVALTGIAFPDAEWG